MMISVVGNDELNTWIGFSEHPGAGSAIVVTFSAWSASGLNSRKESMNFPLDVQREINRARTKHAPIHNLHEGYAMLLEEMDELWNRVKMQNTNHEGDAPTYREFVQIGATAQRIAEDVIMPNPPDQDRPLRASR
jgi:hypothetical protein